MDASKKDLYAEEPSCAEHSFGEEDAPADGEEEVAKNEEIEGSFSASVEDLDTEMSNGDEEDAHAAKCEEKKAAENDVSDKELYDKEMKLLEYEKELEEKLKLLEERDKALEEKRKALKQFEETQEY